MSQPRRSSRLNKGNTLPGLTTATMQSIPSPTGSLADAPPSDEDQYGAGEDLDRTILTAPELVPPSDDEEVRAENDAISNANQHVGDEASGLQREQLQGDALADLRLRFAALQTEKELYKRASDNYKRELANIRASTSATARLSMAGSGPSSASDFEGFSSCGNLRTLRQPAATRSESPRRGPVTLHASTPTSHVSVLLTTAPSTIVANGSIGHATGQQVHFSQHVQPTSVPTQRPVMSTLSYATSAGTTAMLANATSVQPATGALYGSGSTHSVSQRHVSSAAASAVSSASHPHVPYMPYGTITGRQQHFQPSSHQYAPSVPPPSVSIASQRTANYMDYVPGAGPQQYFQMPSPVQPAMYQYASSVPPHAASFAYQPHAHYMPYVSGAGPQQHYHMPSASQPAMHRPLSYMQPVPMEMRFNPDNRRTHDLPKFSGRAEEWPLFICSYTTTSQQFGYTDVENMLRLQKCLTGEAKKRVESVLIRPEHVGRAVNILAKAFGRPEMLVESQINLARALPNVDINHPQQLMDFSVTVDGLVTFLDSEATQHHLHNSYLLNELEGKLPMSERKDWARVARAIQPYPTIRDFARWLDDTACVMSSIRSFSSTVDTAATVPARPRQTNATKPKPSQGSEKFVFLNMAQKSSVVPKASKRCTFCAEAHDIRGCAAFLRLSVRSRLQEIKKNPICYGCLRDDHILPGCNNRKMCGKNGCERWHDPLLHPDDNLSEDNEQRKRAANRPASRGRSTPQNTTVVNAAVEQLAVSSQAGSVAAAGTSTSSPPPSGVNYNVQSTVNSRRSGQSERLLLFRVVPVVLYGPRRSVRTFALLDEGSSVTLIEDALANEMGLDGIETDLDLQFVNSHGTIQSSREVRFGISGVQSDAQRFEIGTVYATSSLTLPLQTVSRSSIVNSNEHLRDVPFAEYDAARPRLLIGLDHHHLGIPLQIRMSTSSNGIVAAMTKLGWVLFGSDGLSALPGAVVLHVRHHHENEHCDEAERWTHLNELVRQHFTTESFGVKAISAVIESDEQMRARQIMASTTKRVGHQFETGLLWACDDVELPDSRVMALHRLVGVESRMRRDEEYARQYRSQIQAYIDKGYARKATEIEAATCGGRSWFLPHFAVRSPSKPGKFRLVFDAAARSAGVSLNSALLAGPDVNVPLTRLLFRFRLGAVGVCADVREMYHQVRIRADDQAAQRFLWRDGDSASSPDVFVMNVMTFGSTCSPASAQYVKNINASEFEDEYPEAADAIRNNHYVDDYVASFRTSDEAIRITKEVVDIQSRGGFDLRGIISNDVAVQRCFGEAEANQTVNMEPEGIVQKILGMTWETNDDTFCFQTRFGRIRPGIMDGSRKPTKRDVLSVTMSIFDPFGMLADFLLASKVVLQELWREDVGWDQPIPDIINARWQAWRTLVERTRLVRIPRCYSPSILSAPGLQLHVFADASEEAFAAVVFWRIQGVDGVEIVFVAGKVRCAPLKMLSIPRMELQAALLAARLMVEIRESHAELAIEKTVLWSDSETVLKWLRCDQRRYKVFVAVRVAEIVENAPAALWRWVPSALNAADDATRVKTPLTFDPESRWRRGPAWLAENETEWPLNPVAAAQIDDDDDELRARFVGALVQRGAVDFNRFSKFYRLVRAIAWAGRFASNARGRRGQRVVGELSAAEVDRAIVTTCRMVQQEAFGEEMAMLRDGKQLANKCPIFLAKPYLDEDGLLRVHGRADAADVRFIPNESKRPILLPHAHRVTFLMVRHYHERQAHQLVDATIAAVRVKFWVPQLRTLVNQVRHACQSCKFRSAMPTPPIQGQLPRDRMDVYARPFTNTGLDFFGPVSVTVGRRHEKRWVALFTCLTVRAVHLEVAADLSTDACLLCIRNLCNIRGVPALIRCDNGTNFVGARNELEREQTFFDADAIQRELSVRGVEWRFNCPGNPEAGGAWERLVQSVKRVLRVTLLEEAPRPETLRSLLIEAANIVNARPLTHLQVTPDDPEPLTPNHFLLGGPNVAIVPNPEDVEPTATRKQWKICRGLSRRFWQQFVRDYLPELTRRGRHYPEQPPLQVGDLVIVCDEQQPRSRWCRGRVVEATPAPDGAVRKATVQTASGTYKRPITRLAKLDVCASDGGDGRGAECRQLV